MKQEREKFSISARIRSFSYSWNGLKLFFRSEHNSWIHAVSAAAVIVLGFVFGVKLWEWALLVLAIGLVFITECINTSIEFLTDLVSPGYHEKAGKVKDLASAAVLIASIIAVCIGAIVFFPYVFALFS
jgi:diacylglycerol kinase